MCLNRDINLFIIEFNILHILYNDNGTNENAKAWGHFSADTNSWYSPFFFFLTIHV